ncbi:hypothetical protein BDU57DRAFT_509731 [Ampelomyces quisqualis]|uniref:Uncharacterized protein n=1 Tax=Ampelomyces quisqualis TaxID=50730 RepID=A0A6A5R0C9_AMPQU|nr:hypothetical protein BDU57DRAFT_509731 [Ampelomyces quisqualis]
MLFGIQHMAVVASLALLSNALPFDTPRQLAPRQKNYSVINVDGGSTEKGDATIVIKPTKTVEVVNPGPTITQEVTTTIVTIQSTSSTRPSATSTPASSKSIPVETPKPKPILVTVTVPKDDGKTEYYDDGLWHTYYRVKSFETTVATPGSSASSTVSGAAFVTSAPLSNPTSM